MDLVSLKVEGTVAKIEFGDPAEKNVLSVLLLEELPKRLAQAEDAAARVVVLRGRGSMWSAGYDVTQIPPEIFSSDPEVVASHPFERCMRAVQDCQLATVAALRGPAFGGALELAATCDLRLAHADATFGLPPAKLGIVYSHTGLQKLLDLLGPAHTRMLVFTGRPCDAHEAERIGLVNRVVPHAEFETAVRALADDIASCAPLAVQGMKKVLHLIERRTPFSEADVRAILGLRKDAFESNDFREGQRAFGEKRPARFKGQ